jgi:hypothetical protein
MKLCLENVFVGFAVKNLRDGSRVNAELFSEFSRRRRRMFNLADLVLGQLSFLDQVVTHRTRLSSTLAKCITLVLQVFSQKQMIRTHTRRIVAAMQNLHAFRNWPVVQFPRESMRINLTHPFLSETDLSVAVASFLPVEEPAFCSLVDFFPKPFFQRLYSSRHGGGV